MGQIKKILFDDKNIPEFSIDEEYLFGEFLGKKLEEKQVQEYEEMQNIIKQSDVSSFMAE